MPTDAKNKMIHARTNLILEQAFWGELAMRLNMIEDPTCETAWVDGKTMGFNPDYVNSLSLMKAVGLVAHEVGHVVLGHIFRQDARNHERWNVACDFALDPILVEAHFDVPDPTVNPQWKNKSAEWIYSQLPRGGKGKGGGQEQGGQHAAGGQSGGKQPKQGAGCGKGEVRQAPQDAPSEGEWTVAIVQAAAAARSAGKLPQSLEYLVQQAIKPRLDWRAIMRRWFQDNAKNDYSWRTPNRRYEEPLILPSFHSESMPPVIFAKDCSGSVGQDEFAACLSEEQSCIDEVLPEFSYLIQCDAAIQGGVDVIERGEELPTAMRKGSGGTSFRPPFKWVTDNQVQPACMVYLTDMYPNDGWPDEPEYPVLWVSVTEGVVAPWGETIYLNDGGVNY